MTEPRASRRWVEGIAIGLIVTVGGGLVLSQIQRGWHLSPASDVQPTTSSLPTNSARARTGAVLFGDGYELGLPKGWHVSTKEFKKIEPKVDAGAKNPGDTKDGFMDNVNVIAQTAVDSPLDQLQRAASMQLEANGSTDIQFRDNVRMDGKDAVQLWSKTKNAAFDAHTIQFMVYNTGKLYVLTVSSNRSEAKAAALSEQIVSGWKWN